MQFTRLIRMLMLVLPLMAATPVSATNSDIGKERRWAEQVIDGLLDGDEVWLIDDLGHEFLGLMTAGGGQSKRAVLLMHGIGVHPNWPDVIYPLRAGLLERGTTTLSIQMPVLANEADEREYARLFEEVPGRVLAALDYLEEEGYDEIVVVAHSLGASMALYYLVREDVAEAVTSAVLIGMGFGGAWPENIEALARVRVPMLDLYGGADLEHVLKSVELRASFGSKNPTGRYRQLRVDGANHFFQGHEDALLRSVIEWLEGPES